MHLKYVLQTKKSDWIKVCITKKTQVTIIYGTARFKLEGNSCVAIRAHYNARNFPRV